MREPEIVGDAAQDLVGRRADPDEQPRQGLVGADRAYARSETGELAAEVTAGGVVTTLARTSGLPTDVAVDCAGNVYVAEEFDHTILKVTAAGGVTTLAGLAGVSGSADGSGSAARFNYPTGVAVDSAGNVYVADQGNHAIRKVTPTGTTTTVTGMSGVGGILLGTTPRFGFPNGLVIVGDSIIVSDTDAILLLRHGAQ